MMKINRFLPFTELSLLQKILWTVVLVIIIVVIYFANLYTTVIDQKTETFKQSKQQAIEQTPITNVVDVNRFHGENHFDIVTGKDKDGKTVYAFVPATEDKKNKVLFRYADAGVSKEEIQKKWKEECASCQLVNITLGMDQKQPLWEITYVDQDNRYVFSYFKFSDGKNYEQFRVNQ